MPPRNPRLVPGATAPHWTNMFQTGGGMIISGGNFVQQNQTSQVVHQCHEADDGFKHLQAHVAPNAYATQQMCDAPKCHPNTRTAVLNDIWSWIVLFSTRIHWALWLYGAAGAGKSAIARSIVDRCLQEQVVIARFFFFRTDPSRNTIDPVVATLVYQLIKQIPDLASIVIPRIQVDPIIFKESFETQFQTLIYEPLQQLHSVSPFQKAILLLLDGVDECEGAWNQKTLISTLIHLLQSKSIPMIVLFASRTENQIKGQFQSPKASAITHPLALDDHYLPDEDIRTFLVDSFTEIHATHPIKHLIPREWPAPALVQEIVTKSSGQFIYASVVIAFISSLRSNPMKQLDIVRGLQPAGSLTPFAQLDTLYNYIFSRVEDLEVTSFVLAHCIIGSPVLKDVSLNLGMSKETVFLALADLSSVINTDRLVHGYNSVEFLHASLPDFLLDPTRSGQYHINKATWSTRIVMECFRTCNHLSFNLSHITTFFPYLQPTAELCEAFIAFHSRIKGLVIPA
ncbi:hypothetical protein HYPSUDRAFT_31439 [Hypholoma sublateritium FD-334 SS-4]|uniref:Nephrocystin 3-like N-terminal domain-containing protein n=1 Tax=Hypholoma sublateritium (strain FD-334 SS-4) TaxID=945553 RepID=A0A0D2PFK0_HYPSF|nr:hypothetical protein HYPSUDRAFT_31439 [Hypholoma sublateritium FD-334 SS-4]